MEIGQRVVALAFQTLGYYVKESVPGKGNCEADILAILVNESGHVTERLHVEVKLSSKPQGVLRRGASHATGKDPVQAAKEFVEKKFLTPNVREAVRRCFGDHAYERRFVYALLTKKAETQIPIIEAEGIKCECVSDLIERARIAGGKTGTMRELDRLLGVFQVAVRGKTAAAAAVS